MTTHSASRITSSTVNRLALVLGPIVVLVVAWSTASVRQDMGIANVALVLATVTTVAALISSVAGLATSIVAALSLNYFHTEPVHSLRISAGSDLLAVALLAALGVVVSTVTAVRLRRTAVVNRAVHADEAARRLREALATNRPATEVWDVAVAAASAQFGLVDVRLESVGDSLLPTVSRKPWDPHSLPEDNMMLLPEGGAIVHFHDPRHTDQLVLTPRPRMGAVSIDRRVALTFADQVEVSLGRLTRSSNLSTPTNS